MSISYYIEDTTALWIKDNIAPYGTNVYYVQKISGYVPNDLAVFDFNDNFNDNSLNTTKWFTDGVGTIQEAGGMVYIACNTTNSYPRYVTNIPMSLRNYMIEYDVKVTGAASEACRIGYTTNYYETVDVTSWFLFFDANRYLTLYTRSAGVYALRWTYSTPISLNTWYKTRIIESPAGIKIQLLAANNTLITESGIINYDYVPSNSVFFGQRTIGDSGYWDNFKIRRYAATEPTISVTTEGSAYKVIVHNNTENELRSYQIAIPASSVGTLTESTSLCIDPIYRAPLKNKYYATLYNCVLNIPDMSRDITNRHIMTTVNTTKSNDRFSAISSSTAFNGINTRCVLTHNTDLDIFNTNTFTLICWIKQIGDYTSTWASLVSKGINLNANRWNLHIISNEVGFYIYDADSILNFSGSYSPININDGQWHMVAFVRNGSNILVYKDGVYIRTYPLTNITNFANTNDVNIGCRLNNGTYEQYFNGEFGEMLLHSTAYSNTQILNYYTLSKYKYVDDTSHVIIF